MKKKIILWFAVLLIGFVGYRVYRMSTTKSHSPMETVNQSHNGLDVKVTYGRPFKKGRLIFGEAQQRAWLPDSKPWKMAFTAVTGLPSTTGALVPYGKYWRLGANEATEISFSKNVNFAGEQVEAGTYRMYAIPNVDGWTVKLNSELGQWGFAEPNYALDVTEVKVPIETVPDPTEQFTINFVSDSSVLLMNFMWDKTAVHIPIKAWE